MVLNFESRRAFEFWKDAGVAQCWVFKDIYKVLQYIDESGIEGEVFFDTSNNKTYQIINSHLEEL